MECKRCNSGYPIQLETSEGFCGFCGSSLKAIEFEADSGQGPFYSDEAEHVKVMLKIKNLGVVDFEIEGLEFS